MEIDRLFRRLLLTQVLLGLLAFGIAGQSYGLMIVLGAIVLIGWTIVEAPGGRSIPQWATVLGAGVAACWLLMNLPESRSGFILGVGYFSLALQILLVISRKTNREYAMILILSVMQIVGASVLSVSIIYGVLLAAYCCLAIVTILVFQLKSTADDVRLRTRQGLPRDATAPTPGAVAGRAMRNHFRQTALGLGLACAGVGAVVFVLAPRTDAVRSTTSVLGEPSFRETGYTTNVDLTKPPDESAGDTQPVAHLTLTFRGQPMQGGRSWRLRGAALDIYDMGKATWRRSQRAAGNEDVHNNVARGIELADVPDNVAQIAGKVVLRRNVDNTLFSLAPVVWVRSAQLDSVAFSRDDQRVSVRQRFSAPLEYEFRSLMAGPGGRGGAVTAAAGSAPVPRGGGARVRPGMRAGPESLVDVLKLQAQQLAAQTGFFGPEDFVRPAGPDAPAADSDNTDSDVAGGEDYMRLWSVNTDQIRLFAQGILRDAGLERDPHDLTNPRDPEIAQALADFLRTRFDYSLTRPPLARGAEPITDFLFSSRQGHCELFASAMTAMARSLGMTARMVSGYLVTEFNEVGGYYVVRQSHAHAWTEIHCGKLGWVEFDPTPAGSTASAGLQRSRFAAMRELYDYVEYHWISWVVAYDQRTRVELLDLIRRTARGAVGLGTRALDLIRGAPGLSMLLGDYSPRELGVVGLLAIAALASSASLLRVVMLRRRRLWALDLRGVPRAQRPALLRSIRFYIATLELLERHGYVRPEAQSPMTFARAVGGRAPEVLDPLADLTSAYYELRFGGRPLDAATESRVQERLRELEARLRAAPARQVKPAPA